MADGLVNRVAVITGGGTGIGLACASAFAHDGATVVLVGRRLSVVDSAARGLVDKGARAFAFALDVADRAGVADFFDSVAKDVGTVDILCNNAGIPASGKLAHEFSATAWDDVLATNLTGAWNLIKAFAPSMVERRCGVITNVASIAGMNGYEMATAYSASKHGMVGLTRTAALDYAPYGVRVNAVCPGPVDTPMLAKARAARGASADAFYLENTPMGRLCRPEEVAAAVVWLSSDEASFVTGHALVVDGGWSAR
jgi:NAD(P)-dependent dehydrogenase (short-subunit alcohol dehydrogenase family)